MTRTKRMVADELSRRYIQGLRKFNSAPSKVHVHGDPTYELGRMAGIFECVALLGIEDRFWAANRNRDPKAPPEDELLFAYFVPWDENQLSLAQRVVERAARRKGAQP